MDQTQAMRGGKAYGHRAGVNAHQVGGALQPPTLPAYPPRRALQGGVGVVSHWWCRQDDGANPGCEHEERGGTSSVAGFSKYTGCPAKLEFQINDVFGPCSVKDILRY